jgi:hypothetical protein
MRTSLAITLSAALVTILAWSPAVLAQQKTVKECRAEWTHNLPASTVCAKDRVVVESKGWDHD